jgi:hypothetical protein
MAKLLQTTITGSLNISGSSLVMPLLTGSTDVHSGSAGQLWINNEGALNLKFTQRGSFGSQNSPFSCLGAFSAGGNLPSARSIVGGFGKSQNSSVLVGGSPPAAGTFHYDGNSWCSGGTLITNRGAYHHTAGTEYAGIVAGGFCAPDPGANVTEEYNGVTWASGGSLIQARYNASGAGVQTGMILVGGDGNPSSPYIRDCVEEYNGTSWTAGAAYYRQDRGQGVTGTANATLGWGGYGPGTIVCTAYNYNGVAWSQTNTALKPVSFGGFFGSANAALSSTGYFSPSVRDCPETQEWNGTTWSIGCNMIQGRRSVGGSGTTFNGLLAGGRCGTPSSVDQVLTEEYTKNLLQPFTYTAAPSSDSWSGGANIITGRHQMAGTGTQNASLAIGGYNTSVVTGTEEYDGSAWSAGGTIITSRFHFLGAAGTQNAGLVFGGYVGPAGSNATEEYGGTSWTSGGNLIRADRASQSFIGTQNAAVGAGGIDNNTCHEHYNGSSWSSQTASPANMACYAGGGTQNGFFIAGGQPSAISTNLIWNGTAWVATSTLNNGVRDASGVGDSEEALIYGGRSAAPGGTTQCSTEKWNGTTWSNDVKLPIATGIGGQAGTVNAASMISGYQSSSPYGIKDHQFYTTIQDIDSSIPYCLGAWSGAANMITARGFTGQGGTSNAAFVVGGYNPAASSPQRVACNEEYNGTAFSAGGALITARGSLAGGGTQNAGIAMAGGAGGADGLACTEEYDGSSFTAGGNMIAGRQGGSGGGTQNAAIYTMGYAPPASVGCTEHYNGSSWSSANAINNIRSESTFAGTQNSAIVMGGNPGPKSCVEEYNGTTWSNRTAMPTARSGPNLSGTQNDAIMAGGGESATSDAFAWDGIAFKGVNKIQNARFYGGVGSQGTSTSHLFMGGRTPTYLANTEEWNCASYNIGAWSRGPDFATPRAAIISIGRSQNAALGIGGYNSSTQYSCVEEFNGLAWSATTATPTVRSRTNGGGTTNDGVFGGGYINDYSLVTEHWNGTSWSSGGNMIQQRLATTAAGATSNAVLNFGGLDSSYRNETEEYNGTSWSAKNTMITARGYLSGAGTTEEAVAFNGATPSGTSCTEEFDGTNWSSAAPSINAAGQLGYASGATNTAALSVSGYPISSCTSEYNGIGFTAKASALVPGQNYGQMVGASDGTVLFGAYAPQAGPATQLFNEGTFGVPSNPINEGIYCFVKNLAPGIESTTGASYSSGY